MIEDIQGKKDTRGMPLELVGITRVKLPLKIESAKGKMQRVVASADFLTDLDHHLKGTHMSRFVQILYKVGNEKISLDSMRKFTEEAKNKLNSKDAYLSLEFPYFIKKRSPVTKNESLLDYNCKLITEIKNNKLSQKLILNIPVMLLCPCSKAISKYNAHNQRSVVTVSVDLNAPIAIEELGSIVEKNASCELFPLLKRPDEKYVTEASYDNPKFVEDLVRDVALILLKDKRINSFVVECESFESIHNHNAYAKINSNGMKKGQKK